MKSSARRQAVPRRRRLLSILCLGLALLPVAAAFPSAGEATAQGSRAAAPQTVSQALLPELSLKPLPSPKSLQEFTADTISRLSAAAPFTSWKTPAPHITRSDQARTAGW